MQGVAFQEAKEGFHQAPGEAETLNGPGGIAGTTRFEAAAARKKR
jgi:hypothetical protein